MSDMPTATDLPELDAFRPGGWRGTPGVLDRDTERAVQARISRLLREADKAEGDTLQAVVAELQDLQTFVRTTLTASDTATPFAVLWGQLETRIDRTLEQVTDRTLVGLDTAAELGARLVDEVLDVAGGNAPVAPPGDVDEAIRQTVRQLLRTAREDLKVRTTQQALLLTSGRSEPGKVVAAVGDRLRGSTVFGAPTQKVAQVVRTESGEAHGAATNARMEQVNRQTSPFELRKRWLWSYDPDDGREHHAFAERRYAPGGSTGPIAPGSEFIVGSFSTPYPRGPGLPGVEKINCGCRSVPVVVPVQGEAA